MVSKVSIKDFVARLCDELALRYPASFDQGGQRKISPARMTKIVEETLAKVGGFGAEQNLGWFGKAKLANELKWELSEKGYSKDFVDLAVEGAVVYLTTRQKS
jgi:hypothetical protein